MGVGRLIDAVYEAGIEALYGQRLADALAKLAERLPNHALFLDVQVVESGDVSTRRNHDVTGCGRVFRRDRDHVLVDDPGIFDGG